MRVASLVFFLVAVIQLSGFVHIRSRAACASPQQEGDRRRSLIRERLFCFALLARLGTIFDTDQLLSRPCRVNPERTLCSATADEIAADI